MSWLVARRGQTWREERESSETKMDVSDNDYAPPEANGHVLDDDEELLTFLIPVFLNYDFFKGCARLFRDPQSSLMFIKYEELPLWAKNIAGRHWSENGGRIELASNGLQVMRTRYSRVFTKGGVELKSGNGASEEDKEHGLVYEDPEVTFYRIAMAAVAVYARREFSWTKDVPLGKKTTDVDGEVLDRIDLSVTRLRTYAMSFYTAMVSLKFVPAGRTLRNAGAGKPVVANCVVLDLKPRTLDNFTVLNEALRLQERGSGVGFPFHMIEPGEVNSSRIGAMGFLLLADQNLGCIEEEGRKGANMAIMSIDHPDIYDFIYAKSRDEFAIKNFNISVSLTDKFMELATNAPDTPWMCEFEGKQYHPREYVRKDNGFNISKIIDHPMTAGELFQLLIKRAWCFGDPGCVFLDEVNRMDPSNLVIYASNPCKLLHLLLQP